MTSLLIVRWCDCSGRVHSSLRTACTPQSILKPFCPYLVGSALLDIIIHVIFLWKGLNLDLKNPTVRQIHVNKTEKNADLLSKKTNS